MLCPPFPDSWEGKRLIKKAGKKKKKKKAGKFSPQRRQTQNHRNLVELEPSMSLQRETWPEQMRRYRWVTLGSRAGRKETQSKSQQVRQHLGPEWTVWCTSVKRAPPSPKVTESNRGHWSWGLDGTPWSPEILPMTQEHVECKLGKRRIPTAPLIRKLL